MGIAKTVPRTRRTQQRTSASFKTPEKRVQEQVIKYLKFQYPNAEYKCDLNGAKLTVGQYVQLKKLGNKAGHPDLVIYEPRKKYHGLFIELKVEYTRLTKKSGEWASAHIKDQAEYIKRLNARGYKAAFAIGFDEAKAIIDDYLGT